VFLYLHTGDAQEWEDSAELDEHAALVSERAGAVLGPYTILKEDHFRGGLGRVQIVLEL